MNTRTLISIFCRGYLVAVLLATVLVGPSPQTWIALVLVLLQGLMLYRTLPPQVDFFVTLVTMMLVPLGLSNLLGPFVGVFVVLPCLALLDLRLRDLADARVVVPFQPGWRSTSTLNALAIVPVAFGLIGLVVGSITTVLVALVLFLALLVRSGHILMVARKRPFTVEVVGLRVLAGQEKQARFSLKNEATFPQRIILNTPDTWLSLAPQSMNLDAGAAEAIEMSLTPILSGPAQPAVQVMSMDPWGFLWRGIEIRPLSVHVIPRARYAAWLAQQFLRQIGTQPTASTAGQSNRMPGVEYVRSREYQPGDRLKDVDWRHSTKFRELIVKEHSDPQGSGTIILLNLVAGDAEEADWLGYQVVASALTAARQGIPAALTAYNNMEVVLTTSSSHPRETLKHALNICAKIAVVAPQERLLAPPDLSQLRRVIRSVGADGPNGGTGTLGDIMLREMKSLEDLARSHPLMKELRRGLKVCPPPATITVISRRNHDTEALAVVLPRLQQQGYRVLDLLGGR